MKNIIKTARALIFKFLCFFQKQFILFGTKRKLKENTSKKSDLLFKLLLLPVFIRRTFTYQIN